VFLGVGGGVSLCVREGGLSTAKWTGDGGCAFLWWERGERGRWKGGGWWGGGFVTYIAQRKRQEQL